MPQMDPELLVLGRLMRSMEAVPGEERRVRICRFLMSRCSETWPIDMKPPGPPWDQLTLFIPTPDRPKRWTHPEGGQVTVWKETTTVPAGVPGSAPVEPAPTVPEAAPEPAPELTPPPSQPETPELWTPPPAAPAPVPPPAAPIPPPAPAPAAPPSGIPATPPPTGYPVPAPGAGQTEAGLDGLR